MNYCIRCNKALISNTNFVSTRTARMDSDKYIYFCDECAELIDSGFFERKLPIDKNLQEMPAPKKRKSDHIVTNPNFVWS